MSRYQWEKLACAYFFVAPALVYAIFTARLPALKIQAALTDASTGIILLFLGCATVCGLAICGAVVDKTGPRIILALSTLCIYLSFIGVCMCAHLWQIILFCICAGFSVGFCDVAMNAQGISLEQHSKNPCLSFLHGMSSAGAVAGSLAGSLFSWLNLSPFLNMLIMGIIFLAPLPLICKKIENRKIEKSGRFAWRGIAGAVYICGILGLLCHIAEGSAGEWGSILLHSYKGASQQEAALVFGVFTAAMVGTRLTADSLRRKLADPLIIIYGSLAGAAGMTLALLSPWPALCLVGYGIMGAGLAPIVPILFSRAGSAPHVTPGQASGVVSVFSYAGLLVFPPFLGMAGQHIGLENMLWLIVAICVFLAWAAYKKMYA